jgi:ABC-type nitrate/sulfonate/bicarbonate transport system substrate-binding protein
MRIPATWDRQRGRSQGQEGRHLQDRLNHRFRGAADPGQEQPAAGKDVAIVQLGGVPEILAGIQSGAVDAGVLSPPTDSKARQEQLKELVNVTKYDVTYYQSPLAVTRSWLAGHRDLALNVLRGYAAGVAFIATNKDQTKAIIGKYTKTTDSAVLEDAYQALLSTLQRVPAPKPEAIQTGLAQSTSPKAKTADPNRFIDASLVAEVQKSGFIDSLYK